MSPPCHAVRRFFHLCLLFSFAVAAFAASPARKSFDVAAGDAIETLPRAAQQAGVEIMFPSAVVRGVRTAAIRGEFTAVAALQRMVAGTPLVVVYDEQSGAIAIDRRPAGQKGAIEGRVFNPSTGEYMERARVTIEGTMLETFTDPGGNYRLSDVPAGTARLNVFYSGFPTATETVVVTAGEVAHRDINLELTTRGKGEELIKMSEYVVTETKEMSGAAIAINEQRFAPNMRQVVATDEMGFVPEANVAELIKFLPGVSVDNIGGFARNVSINGAPPEYVPVTMGGFSLASAAPGGGTGRSTSLDMVSINNLARVEVLFSPTPETQGSALAGSINLIPRSAFERARPFFSWNAYLLMRDNVRNFNATPGPLFSKTPKIHPGFDLTYIRPVNRNFGFTLSAGRSSNYTNQDFMQTVWRGVSAATNGTTYPDTTPDKPYLSSYLVRDNPKESTRTSAGITADWRVTPHDVLSFGVQFSAINLANMRRNLTWNITAVNPGDFSPTFTHGKAGSGTLVLNNNGKQTDNWTWMPTFTWRHNGPVWQSELGLGYSRAKNLLRNIDRGYFNVTNAQRTGVTVSFDDINYLRPDRITVTDAAGAPVDPYNLSSYTMNAAGGSDQHNSDVKRTAFANLQRAFDWRVPVVLKTGVDVRQAERDLTGWTSSSSYVGADGKANTADDSAAPFLDVENSTRVAPFGFPQIQWVSNKVAYDFAQQHPTYFVLNENGLYRDRVSQSKYATELVSAAFLRGDVSLWQRRLKLIGGIRAEQTNIKAEGPLTDPTRNFQRDASGQVIIGSNGKPVPIATDALAVSQLTYIARGAHTDKEYLRLFPSLNASYTIRDNLIARAAVYQSVGRPDWNQYAGGITLPDLNSPAGATNRIIVNNAGIKAWSATTVNARLEYYFQNVGQFSIGAFRRDYKNFFASTTVHSTPEFLALYGLDETTYGEYDVTTQTNISDVVHSTGMDVSYKQSLTFLPHWARGIQVFANATAQRMTGGGEENFAGYVPRTYNWGVSFTRPRYKLRANWNYRGRQRIDLVPAGRSIDPATYNWGAKKLTVDLEGEYYVYKSIAVFANLRNVTNPPDDAEISGPVTPAHAQLRNREDLGSLWTIGVKGSF